MKKLVYIIFLIGIFCSCKKNTYVEEYVINLLSDEVTKRETSERDLILPVSYSYLPVFGLTENNNLVCTRTDYLYYIYSNFYKTDFSNFKDFLTTFLNQKILIPKERFISTKSVFFELDKSVKEYYLGNKFSEFYDKYCTINNKTSFIKKENYEKSDRNNLLTIMYYVSINGYYVKINDYLGLYYIKDWKKEKPPAVQSL